MSSSQHHVEDAVVDLTHACIMYILYVQWFLHLLPAWLYMPKLLTQRLWQCQMKAWNRWGLLDIFHAWWICCTAKVHASILEVHACWHDMHMCGGVMHACVHAWWSMFMFFHACLFAFPIIPIFCDNGAHMHIACMKAEDAVEDEAPTTTPSYQAWSSMPSCMPLSFLIIYIYLSTSWRVAVLLMKKSTMMMTNRSDHLLVA